jgi:CRISPR-associated protein Csh1
MMIDDMRKMAEAFLASPRGDDSGQDLTPEQRRLGFLCEAIDAETPVYVLYPGGDGVAFLRRQEMKSGQSWRAPWIKPGAPNSAYLVPVFKIDREKGGAESKRRTTLKHLEQQARSPSAAAPYFAEALAILQCKRLVIRGNQHYCRISPEAYAAAIEEIISRDGGLNKATPLLIVAIDPAGEVWPGDDPLLVNWLLDTDERRTIYGKSESPTDPAASCALCLSPAPLYPNALPGAGLNFVNGDFRGSFPGMRKRNAWQRFAICSTCADLLYVYKNHIVRDFIEPIIGSNALIIPSVNVGANTKEFGGFIKEVRRMMEHENRAEGERTILRRLSAEATVATLSFLWTEKLSPKSQKIDGIRGFVTHVMPTRLAELEKEANTPFNKRQHPIYPCDLRAGVRRKIDLNLKLAEELLRRPGGLRVKSENQSPRRRALLYELAACVFHGTRIEPGPLWREIDLTAEAYWTTLLGQENAGVLYQCRQEAPKQLKADKWLPLTLNGWVRHLYFFLDYLTDERVNVLPKETVVYQATQELLRPLLSQASGLDTDAKRFAFLLGVLYGHLIYVQAKKANVNVAANSLSWMRGGRLRAAELPELCGKITSKLLEYDALEVGGYRKWEKVHALEAELALLGTRVGSEIKTIELPDEHVLYFLMLGIALSYDFTKTEKP